MRHPISIPMKKEAQGRPKKAAHQQKLQAQRPRSYAGIDPSTWSRLGADVILSCTQPFNSSACRTAAWANRSSASSRASDRSNDSWSRERLDYNSVPGAMSHTEMGPPSRRDESGRCDGFMKSQQDEAANNVHANTVIPKT